MPTRRERTTVKLDGYEWRTLISQVRLGKETYRVIRPAGPVSRGPLVESRHGAELDVDEPSARELAAAWWLAARSPRSLVYLPCRASRTVREQGHEGPELDLVLLHHSLQFPLSRWKSVRGRLSTGAPHTVRLPPNAFPVFSHEEHRAYRVDRDQLRPGIAADTLFLVGSRRAFELESDQLRHLAEDGSAESGDSPTTHDCAEIDLGPRFLVHATSRLPGGVLHVVLREAA
ncbi:hypothetical protein AB0N89_26980 [Amycolatopsis sp. NPDC089917]|uniref:hypothetical protein n=1 Tax=Amycolatopsis sp. NPDC089917 TaxID=3155187 RepID=UPI003438A012